jgi:hypothetical protein
MSGTNDNTEEIKELADFLRAFADANDGGEFEAEQCEKLRKAADEIDRLRAEVAALKAKPDPINDASEEACGELPSGWRVLISLERGAGWVDLIYPDGRMHEVHEDETKVADLIRAAIRKAKEAKP